MVLGKRTKHTRVDPIQRTVTCTPIARGLGVAGEGIHEGRKTAAGTPIRSGMASRRSTFRVGANGIRCRQARVLVTPVT